MSKSNDLTKTYSGMLGNQIVVNKGRRKSVISMPPTKPKPEPSVKQIATYQRLTLAAKYARDALQVPALLAMYAAKSRKGLSPFRIAVNDFLRPPFIHKVNVAGYHGIPGDRISVTAGDDFRLTGVSVKISDAAGTAIEEGPCVMSMPTGAYEYTATKLVTDLTGVVITASAMDLPQHTTVSSITL